jgi:hypothetical protein
MKALSVQAGGKGQSKKERYAQRASFKNYLANIEVVTMEMLLLLHITLGLDLLQLYLTLSAGLAVSSRDAF